jgi:hypothetical protein
MSSKTILSLLQQREDLLKHLGEINAQIIRLTLDHGDAVAALPAGTAARAGRTGALAAKGGARRKWFERGEMVKLTKKVLTQPMSQADLVRALAGAKGYDKGLPTSEKTRFKSAAYQAIAAALNAKQLFRNKQGQVSTRRA